MSKDCRISVFLIFIAVLLVILLSSVYAANYQLIDDNQNVNRSFSILGADAPAGLPAATRWSTVELTPAISKPDVLAVGDTLTLNLFYDAYYTANVDKISNNVNGTVTVRSRIENDPLGYAIITTTGNQSLVEIEIPENEKHFVIQSDYSGQHYLIDRNTAILDELECGSSPVSSDKARMYNALTDNQALANPLDPVTVDVMIVYTPAAHVWADSSGGGIANVIAQAMAKGQLTCDNSNTMLTLNLVYSAEIAYTESGNSLTDLDKLTFYAGYDTAGKDPDHFMDDVQTWRNMYGADLVTLLAKVDDVGGIGWLLSSTGGDPNHAYNLCRVQQSGGSFTVIHELGHNMGCGHHKDQSIQPGPGIFNYSAGWRWIGTDNGRYCSVMTYESGNYYTDGQTHTAVAYFSNPSISYHGVPTGDSFNADNARTIRETKQIVTEYRTVTVSSITPSSAPYTGSVNITNLAGTGFVSGATVKLTKSGQSDIYAIGVTIVSSSQITCSFALSGKAAGKWNVVVTNPNLQIGTLNNGFTIGAPVSSVTLNKIALSLSRGTSETLIPTVNPSDAANKAVTWASDNTAVAIVNSYGLVTAVNSGTCTITVTTVDGSKTATCPINVLISVTGVTFNKSTLSLNKGASETLIATVIPSDAANKAVIWASNNTAVAEVNSSGLVTAVGGGVCAITVTTVENASVAWCVVTVPSVPVTGISFNKTTLPLNNGTSETLIATVSPTDATNKNVIWASSNTAVATVNSSGLVTAVGGGVCAITATTVEMAYVAWCVVTVPSVPVTGISFNKSTTTINVGASETLIATVIPNGAANKNVTWASNNTAVAIVNSSGLVTGVGEGVCAITATTVEGAYVAWCVVTVTLPNNGEMIWIPADSFLMGNSGIGDDAANSNSYELPQHTVTLSGYWIGKYEVTRGEYRQFINAGGYSNPSYWSASGWTWKGSRTEPNYWAESQTWTLGQTFTQTENHPVVGVSYYEAEAFCNWAGAHLPTEAQWEMAARWIGSHANIYPWGDVWNAEKCNNYYDNNSYGGGYGKSQTAPMGCYPSGACPSGCQDMAGNVREWCKDWYMGKYYSQSPTNDPQGPTTGSYRVIRGGSWSDNKSGNRCAYRDYNFPFSYSNNIGFRMAR